MKRGRGAAGDERDETRAGLTFKVIDGWGTLPDGWRAPGAHAAYQQAIVDGRGIPVGPTWCGKDEAALGRELATVRVALAINGEAVDLRHYPRTRRRTRDGSVCEWVGVSVTAPRPGFQALVYTVERDGAAPSRVTVRLRVKEP